MTPDPPEPPTPPVTTYTVTVKNTFNNSYMVNIRCLKNNTTWTPIAGGVTAINNPAVITFQMPTGDEWNHSIFRLFGAAYDSTHPDWDDPAYGTQFNLTDSQTGNSNIDVQYGTDVVGTITGAIYIRIDSQS